MLSAVGVAMGTGEVILHSALAPLISTLWVVIDPDVQCMRISEERLLSIRARESKHRCCRSKLAIDVKATPPVQAAAAPTTL
jgi:hypothetical protein